MATIPRGQDIGRRTPDMQVPIIRQDPREAGGVAFAIADALSHTLDSRTKLEVSKAEAAFLTEKVKHDNAYDDDEDYATISDRYGKGVTDSLGRAASLISDPRVREEFALSTGVRVAEGQERINSLARNKEIDYERAALSSSLEGIRESGLTGSVIDATNAARGYVDAAVENNLISAEEGQRVLSGWTQDMAVAKLEMMDPRDRTEALAAEWAQNLPSDTRIRIAREAKKENDEDTAIIMVAQWMKEGVDPLQANARFAEIEDLDVRVETERRFNNEWTRSVHAESQAKVDILNEYFPKIRAGQMQVSDLPPGTIDALGTDAQTLFAAEQQAATEPPKTSDPEVLWELYQLKNNPQTSGVVLEERFREVAHLLSPSDFNVWANVASRAMTPEDKSTLTYLQYVDAQIRTAYPTQPDRDRQARGATIRLEAEEWRNNFLLQNTREPTTTERNNFVDSLFLELPTKIGGFSGNPKTPVRWGLMTNDQRGAAIGIIKQTEPQVYGYVLELLGQTEQNLNPSQFVEMYQHVYTDEELYEEAIAPDDSYPLPPI